MKTLKCEGVDFEGPSPPTVCLQFRFQGLNTFVLCWVSTPYMPMIGLGQDTPTVWLDTMHAYDGNARVECDWLLVAVGPIPAGHPDLEFRREKTEQKERQQHTTNETDTHLRTHNTEGYFFILKANNGLHDIVFISKDCTNSNFTVMIHSEHTAHRM